MNNTRKAINFDLSTKRLKEYYPGKSYRKAYKDIKSFLCNNGFTHRQWSGYVSDSKMSDYQVQKLTQRLVKEYSWLKKCVNKFDVTDIGEQHDLTHLITGNSKTRLKSKNIVPAKKAQAHYFSCKKLIKASKDHERKREPPTKKRRRSNNIEI